MKNGLSIKSNLERDFKFLELCGNTGNIELYPFDLNEFTKLLIKAQEHSGVVINVKLDDFMKYENYFLNLDTIIPINIISKRNVSKLTLNEMKRINESIDETITPINNSSLSPYEKYIAVYNIVKSFKDYRFYLDNEQFDQKISDQSRNPYLVFINKYIVCAGYTSLLQMFLKKVNIPSHDWTLNMSEESICVNLNNEEKNSLHARLYINIVDSKYGINGYYMCDPTFDNVDKEKSDLYGYKHLSMSCGESHDYGKDTPSYYYFANDDKVFNDQMFINTDNYLKKSKALNDILFIIQDLDPDFFLKLSRIKDKEEQKNIIIKHFKEKTYRKIPLAKKYQAIISVLEFQNEKEFNKEEKQKIYENLYNIDCGISNYEIISDNKKR